jgi:hypothetical protein
LRLSRRSPGNDHVIDKAVVIDIRSLVYLNNLNMMPGQLIGQDMDMYDRSDIYGGLTLKTMRGLILI